MAAANGIAVDALRIQATVEDALNHHSGTPAIAAGDLLAGAPHRDRPITARWCARGRAAA